MPADPKRIQSIFLAAIEAANPTDRAALLARECGDDAELRQRVEELLQAHDRSGSFLDKPVQPITTDAPASQWIDRDAPLALTERPGMRVDRFKLLQQIGEGGMGVVYMAEQEQPVRRRVALKIIKPGMDSAQVIARFEAERQALAMMDHPNIARVLDAGTTDSGRPYFVMELVYGVPITKFCDDSQLTPRQRLELFVPICHAIQHAHQKGIIHRDIKPSNVLVTMHDDKPVPKVIDFGVAKAVEQRLTEKSLFTAFGAVVGTLEYMSPEQAEMNAFGVDTRSDVYSLGALLYELLTGSTPLERKRLREAAYAEVVRLIKEVDPPRPSLRLSSSGDLPKIAAARRMEPTRLSRLLRGEIDWIVMRCLEKDRTRRYESASALARDVERYLRDEAVEACPPSVAYRLRKFARKNRVILSTAAAFVLLLAIATGVSTWLAVVANEKRVEAEEAKQKEADERHRADREMAQAKANAVETGRVLDRMNVAKGIQLAEEGKLFAALACFVNPLERGGLTTEEEQIHQTRIACYKRYTPNRPTLLQMFFHDGPVTQATFSPDAKRVLAVSDKIAYVWDVQNGKSIATLRHPVSVTSAQFTPDGKGVLAAAGSAVWSWDARSGLSIRPPLLDWEALLQHPFLSFPQTPANVWSAIGVHQTIYSPSSSVEISRDGRRVLTQHGQLLRLLEIESRTAIWQGMCDDDNHGRPFALSPDGRSLLFIRDGKASAYNTDTGRITALKGFDDGRAVSVAFSQDGTRALTMRERRANLWNTRTWRPVEELNGEDVLGRDTLGIFGRLSPDNRFVAFSYDRAGRGRILYCYDRDLKRWLTFRTSVAFPAQFTFDWQPSGRQLVQATEKSEVYLWDASLGSVSAPTFSLSSPASAVAFSPDGQKLLTSSDDGVTLVWSLCQEHIDTVATVPTDDLAPSWIGTLRPLHGPSFSIDYKVGIEWQTETVAGPRSIKLLPDNLALERLIPSAVPIYAAAFSSDRSRLIVLQSKEANNGSKTLELKLFDSKSWLQLGKALRFDSGHTSRVAFSPDNRWVAAEDGGGVRLFDAKTGEQIGGPLKHDNKVHNFAFSGDGEVLVTCSVGRKARLWRPKTGEQIGKEMAHGDIVTGAEVSPTHQIIATAARDGQVRLWDRSGTLLGVLQASEPAQRLVFQPNGSLLLVAGSGEWRIWDINSLQQVTPHFRFWVTDSVRFRKDANALLDRDRVICDLTPVRLPADDLVKFTHLFTRHHLDARGGLLPLSKMELQDLWRELSVKYSEEFAVSPKAVVEWRIGQIRSSSSMGLQSEIAFHRRWLALELGEAEWQPGERGNENMETNNYLQRLLALASHGRHAEATAAADALAARWAKDSGTLYDCACVLALAAGSVKSDTMLADRYAARAVVLLDQAIAAGYKDGEHIRKDSDLDALRQRDDFQKLLKKLNAKQP